MTCDQCNRILRLGAMDSLVRDEHNAVFAHLNTGCPRCAGTLAETDETLAFLSLAVPQVVAPEHVREVLISRARLAIQPPTSRRASSLAVWIKLSAAVLVVASTLWAMREHHLLTLSRRQLAHEQDQRRLLEVTTAAEKETVRMLESPSAKVASMNGSVQQPDARGRVVMDNATLHFRAVGLRPTSSGKNYEFWLVTQDNRIIPSGVVNVNPHGEGSLQATIPPDSGTITDAQVTEEPVGGGGDEPTGEVQLAGRVGK